MYKVTGSAHTHAGNVRPNNEDNYFLFGKYREDNSIVEYYGDADCSGGVNLAAVCDGIGGEDAGEVASLIAVEGLAKFQPSMDHETVRKQILDINLAVDNQRRSLGNRMGCTFVGIYLDGKSAYCCNVGDSRAYFLRNGQIRQLSLDHTEVQQQINMGIIKSADEAKGKSKHKLTQNLGITPEDFEIDPYFSELINLQNGDRFLICSDGVTDVLDAEEIGKILGQNKSVAELAKEFVTVSMNKGSRDNVTAVVLIVDEVEGAAVSDEAKRSVSGQANKENIAPPSSANPEAPDDQPNDRKNGIVFILTAIVMMILVLLLAKGISMLAKKGQEDNPVTQDNIESVEDEQETEPENNDSE